MALHYIEERPPVHHLTAEVVRSRRLPDGFARVRLRVPEIARAARPGQFISLVRPGEREDLRVFDSAETWAASYRRAPARAPGSPPLLRRPISIHRVVRGGAIDLLFKIIGRGTVDLAGLRKGDRIDVLGPLGNGFDLEGDYETAVLIAGGAGIAPILCLAESLRRLGKQVILFAGVKDAFPIDMGVFERLGVQVELATEVHHPEYRTGFCTELLERYLNESLQPGIRAFSCGPWLMLKAANTICARHGVPLQVSLEQRMGCVLGACMACVRKVMDGREHNVRVCTEGPVFDARSVVWAE